MQVATQARVAGQAKVLGQVVQSARHAPVEAQEKEFGQLAQLETQVRLAAQGWVRPTQVEQLETQFLPHR